jgi:hypothetical protein
VINTPLESGKGGRGGLAVPADSMHFRSVVESGEKVRIGKGQGAWDGQTRTQEQPRVMEAGDLKQLEHKLDKQGVGGWG